MNLDPIARCCPGPANNFHQKNGYEEARKMADGIYAGEQMMKKRKHVAWAFDLQCFFTTSAAFRENVLRLIGQQFSKMCEKGDPYEPWYIGVNMAGARYTVEVRFEEGLARVFPCSYDEFESLSENELCALILKRDGTGTYGILLDEARDDHKKDTTNA